MNRTPSCAQPTSGSSGRGGSLWASLSSSRLISAQPEGAARGAALAAAAAACSIALTRSAAAGAVLAAGIVCGSEEVGFSSTVIIAPCRNLSESLLLEGATRVLGRSFRLSAWAVHWRSPAVFAARGQVLIQIGGPS
jgi:hypothetical protein